MEVAVLAVIFGSIFGVFYLYFSTRNKERLALIEKGVDATIFMKGQQNKKAAPFWKVLILNLGLLAMGVGVGILLGTLLSYHFGYEGSWENRPQNAIDSGVFYAASIFLCAGGALLIGFNQTKKIRQRVDLYYHTILKTISILLKWFFSVLESLYIVAKFL